MPLLFRKGVGPPLSGKDLVTNILLNLGSISTRQQLDFLLIVAKNKRRGCF